jgi:hypothetical protein
MKTLYDQLVSIFCEIDDFCKGLVLHAPLKAWGLQGKRGPMCQLSLSEIMTIVVMFQCTRYRDFKAYYLKHVLGTWSDCFHRLPTYERFVALLKRAQLPLALWVIAHRGTDSGVAYIDSTCLSVCHPKRRGQHRTFRDLAQSGKTSVGWFFGFKLHVVINDRGDILAVQLTPGNCHDSQVAYQLLSSFQGLAIGDKGYISQALSDALHSQGVHLLTPLRKNMRRDQPLSQTEHTHLLNRSRIETVFGHLKHHFYLWHSRHRSVFNALTHLFSALAAYIFHPLQFTPA